MKSSRSPSDRPSGRSSALASVIFLLLLLPLTALSNQVPFPHSLLYQKPAHQPPPPHLLQSSSHSLDNLIIPPSYPSNTLLITLTLLWRTLLHTLIPQYLLPPPSQLPEFTTSNVALQAKEKLKSKKKNGANQLLKLRIIRLRLITLLGFVMGLIGMRFICVLRVGRGRRFWRVYGGERME